MLLKVKPITQKGPQCHSLQSQSICLSDKSSALLLSGSSFLRSNKRRDSGFSFFHTNDDTLRIPSCTWNAFTDYYLENILPSSQKAPPLRLTPGILDCFSFYSCTLLQSGLCHILGNVVMNNFMHTYFLWGVCLQGKSLRA